VTWFINNIFAVQKKKVDLKNKNGLLPSSLWDFATDIYLVFE
jgi:hypothetical protein